MPWFGRLASCRHPYWRYVRRKALLNSILNIQIQRRCESKSRSPSNEDGYGIAGTATMSSRKCLHTARRGGSLEIVNIITRLDPAALSHYTRGSIPRLQLTRDTVARGCRQVFHGDSRKIFRRLAPFFRRADHAEFSPDPLRRAASRRCVTRNSQPPPLYKVIFQQSSGRFIEKNEYHVCTYIQT